jgi:hypothetical protein
LKIAIVVKESVSPEATVRGLKELAEDGEKEAFFRAMGRATRVRESWKKIFLAETCEDMGDAYVQGNYAREFFGSVAKGMSLIETKEFLKRILRRGRTLETEAQWVEVGMLFEAHPRWNKVLRQIFPVKERIQSDVPSIVRAQEIIFNEEQADLM